MNILFVSPWYPIPADNGAKLRILNLVNALSSQHEVHLLSLVDKTVDEVEASIELLGHCSSVKIISHIPSTPKGIRRWSSFFSPLPHWVFWQRNDSMQNAIVELTHCLIPDLVIAYELSTAVYDYSSGKCPVILEDLELGGYGRTPSSQKPSRWNIRKRSYWHKVRRSLPTLMAKFSGCTVVSEPDLRLFRSICPSYQPVELIPNCVRYADYANVRCEQMSNVLVFSGALTFTANYESIVDFLLRIYPLVKRSLPDVQLWITGDHGNLPLPTDATDASVIRLGRVDNIKQVVASCTVSVVPIVRGGGTRFKILEAMALGTPVVSTSKGAEGISVNSGCHLMIADTPEDFAGAVVQVCLDEQLRTHLINNARNLIRDHYDWASVTPRYLAFLERIADRWHGRGVAN